MQKSAKIIRYWPGGNNMIAVEWLVFGDLVTFTLVLVVLPVLPLAIPATVGHIATPTTGAGNHIATNMTTAAHYFSTISSRMIKLNIVLQLLTVNLCCCWSLLSVKNINCNDYSSLIKLITFLFQNPPIQIKAILKYFMNRLNKSNNIFFGKTNNCLFDVFFAQIHNWQERVRCI